VEILNDYIKDLRPIPCYRRTDKTKLAFKFIEVPNTKSTRRRAFLRPFHWDLRKDIRTLREEALKVKACTYYIQKLWREYKRNQVVDI
jgi:hypothetical protein